MSKKPQTHSSHNQLTLLGLLKWLFGWIFYPVAYFVVPKANGTSLLPRLYQLIWGITAPQSKIEKFGFVHLPKDIRRSIGLYALATILLQIFLIYIFVKFSLFEALFWRSLVNIEQSIFYSAGFMLIAFKLLEIGTELVTRFMKSQVIIKWRQGFVSMWFSDVASRKPYKDDVNNIPQIIEQNVEDCVTAGVNILFNAVTTLLLIAYCCYLIFSCSPYVIVMSVCLAVALKFLLDVVSYAAGDIWKRYRDDKANLRDKLSHFFRRSHLTLNFGWAAAEKKLIDDSSVELSRTTQTRVFFDNVINALRWGLRQIIEPVITITVAALYFTGKVVFSRMNLIANSAIKLVHLILDLVADIDRYNQFSATMDSISLALPSSELPSGNNDVSKQNLPDEFTFRNKQYSIKGGLSISPGITGIKGENNIGKTYLFTNLAGGERICDAWQGNFKQGQVIYLPATFSDFGAGMRDLIKQAASKKQAEQYQKIKNNFKGLFSGGVELSQGLDALDLFLLLLSTFGNISNKPKLLVVDEFFAFLSESTFAQVKDKLDQICKDYELSVWLISHGVKGQEREITTNRI